MKKKIYALFVAFTLIFGLSSYANAAGNIQINKSSNNISLSGQVKDKNENVTLLVLKGSDNTRMYIDQMKSDSNGNFKFDIYLDYGDYKAQVCTKNDKYDVGSFSVLKEDSKPENPSSGGHGSSNNGGGGSGDPVKENNKITTFEFSKDKLINDINNAAKTELVLDATASNSSDTIQIKLTNDAIKSILDNKKELLMKSNDISFKLNQQLLNQISKDGDLKLTVSQLSLDKVKNNQSNLSIVSQIYDFNLQSGNKDISNFESPVAVTMKIDTTKVTDAKKVVAYYYNETTGQWETVGGNLDPKTGILTFTTTHFSKYAAIEYNKTFRDVKDHWAKYNIEVMSAKNIVKGVSEDSFAPNENISRAEFCTLLARSLNLKQDSYKGVFKDVSSDSWYSKAVEAVSNANIVNGFDGFFNPNAKITREEMAVMIVRAMEYKKINLSKSDLSFKDKDSIASWSEDYIKKAVSKGIMKGIDDNKFSPKSNATRAEATVMMYRIINEIDN